MCICAIPSIHFAFVNPFHRMCTLSLGSRKYFFPSSSLSLPPTHHPSQIQSGTFACNTHNTQLRYTTTNTQPNCNIPVCLFALGLITYSPHPLNSSIKDTDHAFKHCTIQCLLDTYHSHPPLSRSSSLLFLLFFSSILATFPSTPLRVSFISRIFCTKYIYVLTHFQLDIFQRKFLRGEQAVLCDHSRTKKKKKRILPVARCPSKDHGRWLNTGETLTIVNHRFL